ncbi:thioredoxin domain-containing protein [Candidatus Woesearchaeota archaeon]|jgi:protein-disulfide isomerase|nr:thioredoxin domain-containing protein [Candidatus Woesearchaeota archaeon]MBT4387513.1 thioredoxin domain-containing protein [Candidatus Woesearchaeota archaeon]MBT4595355.1 thioredoxin domain-containing protein [Candidatus Woesearchaeota archaeon]MBT5741240.1 thioredoxin domain-containing protein [Candidatus Woesearchaeota archaeon]MBT6505864.1 thioredoxin domain-containing protein [Candidatus Woesearchaeota archaeon]
MSEDNSEKHKETHENKVHHEHHHKHDHSNENHETKKDLKKDVLTWQIVSAVLLIALVFVTFNPINPASIENTNNNNNNQAVFEGKIKIIEYSDFECPYCASFAPTAKRIREELGDQVEFEYKHFPLDIHPNARSAALASECAREQNKFWEYHDALFENQRSLGSELYIELASNFELNMEDFNSCIETEKYSNKVDADFSEAQLVGVSGTPSFTINGQLSVGNLPYEEMLQKINAAKGQEVVEPKQITDDPQLSMKLLTIENCYVCDTEQIETALLELFPTLEIERVDSQTSQQLLNELGIETVPAMLFDQNLVDTSNYQKLSQVFDQNGEYYVFALDRVGAPLQILNEIDISEYPVLGDENAPITILEFSDFECPFCSKAYNEVVKDIKTNLIETGKAKLAFGDFPLVQIHPNAFKASEAAQCARDQNKFWEFHDVLFETKRLSINDLKQHAVDLGLDTELFNTCLSSSEKAKYVNDGMTNGAKLGVSGTPAFFVNGVLISGAVPYEVFENLITEMGLN